MNLTTLLAIYALILSTITAIIAFLKFRKEGELIKATITFGSFTHNLMKKGPECLLIEFHNKGNKISTINGCSYFNSENEKISLTENINNLPKEIKTGDHFIVALDKMMVNQNNLRKIEFYTSSGKTITISKRKLNKVLSKMNREELSSDLASCNKGVMK